GNAAAGADGRCLRTRIKSDMRQVTDECCQCNERQITQWSQKIFHGMTKRQQEIHVPSKMNDTCVQEERCDECESVKSGRFRWNQSETLSKVVEIRKRKETCANDDR